MSFRVLLARPRGADPTRFQAVYLHNGARPAELGPVLWTLMRDRYRFDAAAFAREMIDGNAAGWSDIDCLGGPLARTWDGRTKLTVEAHQRNFNEGREDKGPTSFAGDPMREIPGLSGPPIDDSSDNWDAELAYVVGADGLSILLPEGPSGPYSLVTTLPWGDEEPDWDVVEESMDSADGGDEADDEDADDEGDEAGGYDEGDQWAHETPETNALLSSTFEWVQRGEIARAQATLLGYLDKGGKRTPGVLTNLFFTLSRQPLAASKLASLVDETLAAMETNPTLLSATLIDNVCVVLNNVGRGGDSLRLCELAMERGRLLSANCYVGLTFGAYGSQDPTLMRRAVAHIERVMTTNQALLVQNPAVFDNTAALYVALGDKPKALAYVRLCKEHGYENFAEMPEMPDYAPIKDDADFKKLFRP